MGDNSVVSRENNPLLYNSFQLGTPGKIDKYLFLYSHWQVILKYIKGSPFNSLSSMYKIEIKDNNILAKAIWRKYFETKYVSNENQEKKNIVYV